MKIETKLLLKNMQQNKKRTIFTIISVTMCSFLIITTMIIISSIRNGISENISIKYNDYCYILKDVDIESFNKIKGKEYIENTYIQENDGEQLYEIDELKDPFEKSDTINLYIKYDNVRNTYKYSTDVIQTLDLSLTEAMYRCEFNDKLLMVYGLMGATLQYVDATQTTIMYISTLNFSYILDLMIVGILVVFSVIFIIILYNAFLITINERKREYAILNSIGATGTQILKMVFLEGAIIGICGIIIGGFISYFSSNIILKILNNILAPTTYNFKLVIDIKYIIIAILIIIYNIYISAIIPSMKASSTSVMQNIRNNKQIKHKKRKSILEHLLPIEGKVALRNIKRDKNKYRVITILLVICMTSYISISTYINYEKESSDLVNKYDVDAELGFNSTSNINYKSIINNYAVNSNSNVEYMEYKISGLFALVDPNIITSDTLNIYGKTDEDNKIIINIVLIGLDEGTYSKYINKLGANIGDYIIYNTALDNTAMNDEEKEEYVHRYYTVFKTNENLKLDIVRRLYNDGLHKYEITDNENLRGKFILTDELIDGYKEMKNEFSHAPTIFVNMDTYNKIIEKVANNDSNGLSKWIDTDHPICVKVKCENIIQFSNYIENIKKEQNIDIWSNYYSLDNQEKIIYINILQLILRTIISVIIGITIISTISVINASLSERKNEFKIFVSLGALKKNINKILIYESIYIFVKAVIISIILSIPILYIIIKYIEKVVILNKLFIPIGDICIFIIILFLISLFITVCSGKSIKSKRIN